jgi:hypothetical protein
MEVKNRKLTQSKLNFYETKIDNNFNEFEKRRNQVLLSRKQQEKIYYDQKIKKNNNNCSLEVQDMTKMKNKEAKHDQIFTNSSLTWLEKTQFYLDNPFEKQNHRENLPKIKLNKLSFYQQLLRKDSYDLYNFETNSSSLFFDSIAKRTENFLPSNQRHISMKHIKELEKKYNQNRQTYSSLKSNLNLPHLGKIYTVVEPDKSALRKIPENQEHLSIGLKFLTRMNFFAHTLNNASDLNLRSGYQIAIDQIDDLNNSQIYAASIGEVPNLYPTVSLTKPSRLYIRMSKKHKKKNKFKILDDNCMDHNHNFNNFHTNDQKLKTLNFDKTRMTLKEKFKIKLEIDKSFNHTKMLGKRHIDSSLNSIRLNFSTVDNYSSYLDDRNELNEQNVKHGSRASSRLSEKSLVLPHIFKR